MNRISFAIALAVSIVALLPVTGRAEPLGTIEERMNAYLEQAGISEGVAAFSAELEGSPDNEELRFATGVMQFMEAVQTLGQSWYRYGLRTDSTFAQGLPFLRLLVPANPRPEPVSHAQAREVLDRFVRDLMAAENTLAVIDGESVALGLHIGRAYLDFNGDGTGGEAEALWRIYAGLNRGMNITEEQAAGFLVRLDAGDVHWLRGYCHLLSALLDFYLAHDDSRLFNHTAHLFFANPEIPFPFLKSRSPGRQDFMPFLDGIALIHLIQLPVTDPARSEAALDHLQQVIALSRKSWDLYGKETDDDREWIPNPNQTGVVPGVQVTEDMVDQWLAFLAEAEAILSGKVLIPFWRGDKPLGVNLRRVFTEPETLDLVLWVQGTAAAPYLEEGTLTRPEFWDRLMQAFNGRFVGFALWFN